MSPRSVAQSAQASRRARGSRNRTLARSVLNFELLEDRRLLDATPWHNSSLPLDVSQNGVVTPADAVAIISELLNHGIHALVAPALGDPPITRFYDTTGDNVVSPADALKVINRLFYPPQVTFSTALPFTVDVTPEVTVKATGIGAVDGSRVSVDVDLDGDGRFDSLGETGHTLSSLYKGSATFDIARPGFAPADLGTGPFRVKLRAQVIDVDGVPGTSARVELEVDTTMSDVLKEYVYPDVPDPAFSVSEQPVSTFGGPGFTVYVFDLKSQTWRSPAEVNRTEWQHWMQLIVPSVVTHSTALLNIDGGNNTLGAPDSISDDLFVAALGQIAFERKMIVVHLPQVPNQTLHFPDDPPTLNRREDEIIAYSYDKFMSHIGEPGNETWPLLLPMVKSAVRAMDAAQLRDTTVPGGVDITDFIVTGGSKRGWTTWLTAAVDDRVKAIIPAVFDMLNQGPQLVHHYGAYGFFSDQIQDYSDKNIFERITTPAGRELGAIVDPYRYLNNGRFEIPKLVLVSAGDQFFVPDSAQYYFHDLPGTDNYLRYIPNTGHGLDGRAIDSIETFYDAVVNGNPLPKFSWSILPDQSIRVQTIDTPKQVLLWQATNTGSVPPTGPQHAVRDFRWDYFNPQIAWSSTLLTDPGGSRVYIGNTPIPATGATAYMVELTFDSPIGIPYVFTTEIRVNTNLPLFPWPFPVDSSSAAALSNSAAVTSAIVGASADLNTGLYSAAAPSFAVQNIVVASPPPPDDATDAATESSPARSLMQSPDSDAQEAASDSDLDAAAVDLVLDETAEEALV